MISYFIAILNKTGSDFCQYGFTMLIQSSMLIAILLGIDLFLRRHVRAICRYWIWMLVLVKLMLPVSLCLPTGIGYWWGDRLPVGPLISNTVWVVPPDQFDYSMASGEFSQPIEPSATEVFEVPPEAPDAIVPAEPLAAKAPVFSDLPPVTWQGVVFVVWLVGVLLLSVLLIQRIWFVRGLIAQTKPAEGRLHELLNECRGHIGIKQNVELRISQSTSSPAACGLFSPKILLPVFLLERISREKLRTILIHELTHIKRGDLWVNLIQTILQIINFYNPLFWAANFIIRRVREQAVDEMVLTSLGDEAGNYSNVLVDVAAIASARPSLSLGLVGVVESKKALAGRIRHIISRPFPRSAKLGVVGIVAVIVGAAVLLPMARGETEKGSAGLESSQETLAGETEQSSNKEMPNIVSGVVTDKLGRFRSHVYISPCGTNVWGEIRTDTEGYFTIENIEPEQKVWLAYSQHSKAMGFFAIPENYKGQRLHVVLDYQEAEISGRVVDGNGAGLADRQVELIFTTKEDLSFTLGTYEKTDQYGVYWTAPVPCGSGLRVHARVINMDENEQEYVTDPITLTDNQINVEMPLLTIGQGQYKDSDDGRVLYSGRVLNEQGAPIEGAGLELGFDISGWMSRWIGSAMTNEQGRWSCHVPVNHSNLSVRLLHPDHIGFHYDGFSRIPAKAELLDGSNIMVMKKGLRIKGIVQTPEGKPIENALVAAGRHYSSSDGRIIEDCTTDITGADGSFSIGGLPQQQIELDVSVPGYAPVITSVKVSKNTEPIEVTLKKGRIYRGQIVDKDGNPLEEIKVHCDEWNVEGKRRHFSVLTKTDSQGLFSVHDIPDTGTLTFGFGRSRTPLEIFSKQMPEDLAAIDIMTMYPVPVIAAKVIDARTKEPVTNFTITHGCKWKAADEEPSWSGYYKDQISSEDGSFEKKWDGFHITYPFDGAAFIKIEAQGYYSQSTPPVELGKQYQPFVIELTKSRELTGIIVDSDGNPAGGAEVGWVGPGRRAFINDGKFDERDFYTQAETIVTADHQGHFSLNPERGVGLIVVMHEQGYAQLGSADFKNGSEIKLSAWAKIEGTIGATNKANREAVISVNLIESRDNSEAPRISWLFDEISVSGKEFTIDYVPSVPLYVGQIVGFEQSDSTYFQPEPGKTYRIEIGGKGPTVRGKIVMPTGADVKDVFSIDMSNPRQAHVAAYRITPEAKIPATIGTIQQSSFLWLWRDKKNVYERSTSFQKRFIPVIEDDGEFCFENLPPGQYEFVLNLHAPLGEKVSCGRGVLKAVGVSEFTVPNDAEGKQIRIPSVVVELLTHPEVGDQAPLFEADSFDVGKTIKLKDFRNKIVLLDFWATWCGPCVAQMPKLKALHEKFADDERFVMIGMSLDEDIDKAKRFTAREELKWSQAALGDMSKSTIVKEYGIDGVPMTILIGPEGEILAMNLPTSELEAALNKVLSALR